MPKVDADAKIKSDTKLEEDDDDGNELKDSIDGDSSDSEEGDGEVKKKRMKEKIGFRDRKVIILD